MTTTAQIGASGELLVQYRLLKHGIESARMTTDAGVDLVVYDSRLGRARTVQVKTCGQPKPAGGKGRPALDWWLSKTCPAELIALCDLSTDGAWIFDRGQFEHHKQQETDRSYHFCMYIEPDYVARVGKHVRDFDCYLLEQRIPHLFGMEHGPEIMPSDPSLCGAT